MVPPSCERRASWPDLRRLLEGVRELQHAEIIAVTPDDLDADRQPLRRERRGHRHRRMAGDGDVVAALHPVEIIAHLDAGDLAWPFLLERERRQLVHRADE